MDKLKSTFIHPRHDPERWLEIYGDKGTGNDIKAALLRIADDLKSLYNVTGSRAFIRMADKLDAIAELEVIAVKLRDALEGLVAVQNGPPLIRDQAEWQAAMTKADTLLQSPSVAGLGSDD